MKRIILLSLFLVGCVHEGIPVQGQQLANNQLALTKIYAGPNLTIYRFIDTGYYCFLVQSTNGVGITCK